MSAQETLRQWQRLADELVAQSSREQLVQAARILALNCAHYASRLGEPPLAEQLDIPEPADLSDEQARLFAAGMKTLVEVLGSLRGEASP